MLDLNPYSKLVKTIMVDIIDVGMGNVKSVKNAITRLGVATNIISNPNDFSSDTIILPGVGSAEPFMYKVRREGFDLAINEHATKGKRIIGICLGFQVMTHFSEEDGGTQCLGLINTETTLLRHKEVVLNHNQWEKFSLRKNQYFFPRLSMSQLGKKKRTINGRVFYNHEYGVRIPVDNSCYKSIDSNLLSSFASMYCNDNIIGIQFHPEKSQTTGLEVLSFVL